MQRAKSWPYPRLVAVDKRDVTPKYILEDVTIKYLTQEKVMSIGILYGMSFDMILGMDFLTTFALTIDVPRKLIMPTDVILQQFKSLYSRQSENLRKIRLLTEQNLKLIEENKGISRC